MLNNLIREKADVVHAHSYIFFTSNQAALARKINQQPLLLHLHGAISAIPPKGYRSLRFQYLTMKPIYDRTFGKWTLKTADLIASVSKLDIESCKDLFKIDEKRFHWLPNAVDTTIFNGSERSNSSNDESYVLFIGNLVPRKGIADLLKVAKIIIKKRSNTFFVLIGDGPLRKWLELNIHSFHGKVKVLGKVSQEILLKWLSKASVLLLPSYSEGLPTVCLEALASEVPVVASNIGGTSEIVLEGETGYLFPPGNTQLCAEKVLRLLDDDKLQRKMGRCGRSLVKQFYTWRKVVEKTERIYKKIGG